MRSKRRTCCRYFLLYSVETLKNSRHRGHSRREISLGGFPKDRIGLPASGICWFSKWKVLISRFLQEGQSPCKTVPRESLWPILRFWLCYCCSSRRKRELMDLPKDPVQKCMSVECYSFWQIKCRQGCQRNKSNLSDLEEVDI